MSRLRLLRSALLSTLWFVPSLLVGGSVVLAVLLVEVSDTVDAEVLQRWPRLFGASAGSSRDMLATIAGSIITVAGVTFSITMVAVTQASAQYTPRILRNFMRDRPSQIVLGGMTGVFAYCLVVLRTIRGSEASTYIPSLAVLAAFVLAAVAVGLLIYFVHHMATALQASSIIARVAEDTIAAIDAMFPDDVGGPAPRLPSDLPLVASRSWMPIRSTRTGYIQNIDPEVLLTAAATHDVIVRLDHAAGDFVVAGSSLASWTATREVTAGELAAAVRPAFTLGTFRTVEQDPGFGIRQLVDIAVKALSQGVNDPTTALTCIDYLGAVLVRAAARRETPAWRESNGDIRVIAQGHTFHGLLDSAFDAIRRYGEGHAEVLGRQLGTLALIGAATGDPDRRRRLVTHVDLLADAVERTIAAPADRGALLVQAAEVRAAVGDER